MIPNYTKEFGQLVLDKLYECGGNYAKAANKLNVAVRTVMGVDMVENRAFNYTPEGNGPKNLQPYLIAKKDCQDQWDLEDKKIQFARAKYNEGLIEMVTGRDGFNTLLYAIPRREPEENRKPYFENYINSQTNVVQLGA